MHDCARGFEEEFGVGIWVDSFVFISIRWDFEWRQGRCQTRTPTRISRDECTVDVQQRATRVDEYDLERGFA